MTREEIWSRFNAGSLLDEEALNTLIRDIDLAKEILKARGGNRDVLVGLEDDRKAARDRLYGLLFR